MLSKDGAHLGYQTHYVVDGGKDRITLNVLVTPAEVMENQPMRDLVWRTCFRWKLRPRHVTGDTKYGTEDNIVALETQHIRAYVALPALDERTEFFPPSRFRYEAERDVYICPAGKELHWYRGQSTERQLRYRARARDCNHCPLKAQCTTSKQGRSLCRSVHEELLDRVRAYHATEAYKKAYRKRTVWVEPLFAEGKDWHGMRRFRLRQLWRVNCEALMRAGGQNLKRLLKKRGWGRRPCPTEAVSPSFGCLLVVSSSLFRRVAFFLADVLRLLNAHEGMLFHFTDEFRKSIFQHAEMSSGEISPAQIGPHQAGSTEAGAAQVSSTQIGLLEVGLGELGSAQVSPSQVGSRELGSREAGLEGGSAQVSIVEPGVFEVGAAQIGSAQVGSHEVGISESGLAEGGPAQVGPAQVGSREIDSPEAGSAQVWS